MTEDEAYWSEDEWRKNGWRCGHGWLRGEQCEICNAPKREWVGLTDEDLEFWTEELGQGELGRGVIRAVADHLKERNT
jgi:hypothetical protein